MCRNVKKYRFYLLFIYFASLIIKWIIMNVCMYGIHHWRILWSSYKKLAWVGFEPTTTESCSNALTDWAIRPWVQLTLRANFDPRHMSAQISQSHRRKKSVMCPPGHHQNSFVATHALGHKALTNQSFEKILKSLRGKCVLNGTFEANLQMIFLINLHFVLNSVGNLLLVILVWSCF